MAEETSAPVSAESPATPKKASPKKTKKAAKVAAHPATATMVMSAIEDLKERGGSSLQAIKKYIGSTYEVDAEKYAPYIRKYIKASVTAGSLIQTKGKGASGSFKLAGTGKNSQPAAAASDKPRGRPRKAAGRSPSPKKSPAKKASRAKKEAAPAASPKKAARAKAPKSPSKAKKTAKSPTRKPKSPKPKTTKKAVTKSPRKAASPKKK